MKKVYLLLLSIALGAPGLFAQSESVKKSTEKPVPYRVGKWLPSDQAVLDKWLHQLITDENGNIAELLPVVKEFRDLIEGSPELYVLFHQMFEQIPQKAPYNNDPAGKPQIRDYRHMLHLINYQLTKAPEFNKTGLVGFPINAILAWPMGTTAGQAAFLDDRVNRQIKKILAQWAIYLGSADSRYVLNNDPHSGWFGKDAHMAMPTFTENFKCDPKLPHYGFTSWDNFFTREFREGKRPVANPDDNTIIANACESAPYRISKGVKFRDKFWLKGQPYSLTDMMNGDPLAEQFSGGTIYQAFLSAFAYHRWHSPVSGKIVKAYVIDGSYYAESQTVGFDPEGPNESQAYITEVATRALVFIEADNPDIGLMAVMFVGMAEVSTCEITAYEGQHLNKGDQLGMFHFGGSTHCLIFRPEVKLEFDLRGQQPSLNSKNVPVKSKIARVLK